MFCRLASVCVGEHLGFHVFTLALCLRLSFVSFPPYHLISSSLSSLMLHFISICASFIQSCFFYSSLLFCSLISHSFPRCLFQVLGRRGLASRVADDQLVLTGQSPVAPLLNHPFLVVQRQLEMMNIFLGFEQVRQLLNAKRAGRKKKTTVLMTVLLNT